MNGYNKIMLADMLKTEDFPPGLVRDVERVESLSASVGTPGEEKELNRETLALVVFQWERADAVTPIFPSLK